MKDINSWPAHPAGRVEIEAGWLRRADCRRTAATIGRGFGKRNLFRMIRFTEVFPDNKIVSALRTQLGWTLFKEARRDPRGRTLQNDRAIFQGAGKVSAQLAKAHAEQAFDEFRVLDDQRFESDFDQMLKQLPTPTQGKQK